VTLAETRPTSDLIRGVIFDMLDAMEADYDRVLDLYAGTGALGIEALSRGEGSADFVDRDAGAIAIIKQNLRTCGFEERAAIHHLTTERAASRLGDDGPYTLILADPPYYDDGALAAVENVASSALAGEESVLVYEHHRRLEPPAALGKLNLHKSRRHGDTVVSIYRGEAFA
jgi:16S rRNA (guanine(966)-N(2))-methyltransferase RsmD